MGEKNTAALPASEPDAAAAARTGADARAKLLGWARRTVDLVPTPWLVTGAGAVLLATTAAFGGLEAMPATAVPELSVGDTYRGSDLELTVVGVELRDERGDAMVFPDEEKGEKVLVVVVDVVNTFGKPRPSAAHAEASPTVDGIRLDGAEGAPSLSRTDDGGIPGMLQPDVPARLLLAWLVGPSDFRDGETVTLTLPDSTHHVGDNVLRGQDFWDEVRVGATVTATIEKAKTP
ncbi:hypothetical protein [Microbacterium sp. SD291]|uniref:hypothetical protein n=1 Tax=Microbacterium sp. SD291 TaxID=2782007 RepID=UPI001A95B5BB|nr:hypothetical protein [Microbacterium sp. SD291]MBO0979686.1 hypothetical protein [Microbacterium sp. SD291]